MECAAVVLFGAAGEVLSSEECDELVAADGGEVVGLGVPEHGSDEDFAFFDGAFGEVLCAHVCGPVVDDV